MEVSRPREIVRFGPYETRLRTQELFKHGLRLKLAPQAFQVLRILLDRPGELVTREDLHQALWSADTFVDFDHGLNNAIKRIRDVLGDSVDAPLYIETLPRLGYRFIGQITENGNETAATIAGDPTPSVNVLNSVDSSDDRRVLDEEAGDLGLACWLSPAHSCLCSLLSATLAGGEHILSNSTTRAA